MNRHEAVELRLDLLDHHGRARGDDGDAGGVFRLVHLGHGQALDIVATAREQPDDARKHTRLIVHKHGNGMPFNFFFLAHSRTLIRGRWGNPGYDGSDSQTSILPASVTVGASASSARIIWLCAAPDGIIG